MVKVFGTKIAGDKEFPFRLSPAFFWRGSRDGHDTTQASRPFDFAQDKLCRYSVDAQCK
jgi:hypothetical protein